MSSFGERFRGTVLETRPFGLEAWTGGRTIRVQINIRGTKLIDWFHYHVVHRDNVMDDLKYNPDGLPIILHQDVAEYQNFIEPRDRYYHVFRCDHCYRNHRYACYTKYLGTHLRNVHFVSLPIKVTPRPRFLRPIQQRQYKPRCLTYVEEEEEIEEM